MTTPPAPRTHLSATTLGSALLVLTLAACGRPQQEEIAPRPTTFEKAVRRGTRTNVGVPGPNFWAHQIDYTIDAVLDTASATVRADATIRFINRSPHDLESLVLRLDQNRFRMPHGADLPPESRTDGMVISRMSVDGKEVPLTSSTDRLPRLSGAEGTVAELMLERPLASGQTASIAIAWHFEVPLDTSGLAIRQGRWGRRTFQVAQWYPRIAMHDDLAEWDRSPFRGNVEFYNPFADFDVRVTVPSGWPVGATGTLVDSSRSVGDSALAVLRIAAASDTLVRVRLASDGGAVSTWHFSASHVSDFAWATSADYTWHSASVPLSGAHRVQYHVLMTPANASRVPSVNATVRRDLVANSARVARYPFPGLTLVDGPEGGMEYPMLIMSNGDDRLGHELWHQWFPMLVGTDESRFAFLDEGFATFLASRSFNDPATSAARPGSGTPPRVPLLHLESPSEPHALAALYGYSRGAAMLGALRDTLGDSLFLRALREYTGAWRGRHATPWDFMNAVERSSGRELSAFWRRWLYSTE